VTKPGKVVAARMGVVATDAIAFVAKWKWEGITIVIDNSMDSKTKIE